MRGEETGQAAVNLQHRCGLPSEFGDMRNGSLSLGSVVTPRCLRWMHGIGCWAESQNNLVIEEWNDASVNTNK